MTRPVYVPPSGDEPLDEIERALVRCLVKIVAREIRAELEAERAAQQEGPGVQGPLMDDRAPRPAPFLSRQKRREGNR